MLARFLARRQHPPWQPEPEEIRHLRALLSRLEALDKDSREHHRWEKAQIQNAAKAVLASIHTVLETLTRERKRRAKEINDHIDRHDSLKQGRALLELIPGSGEVLSVELLAMPRSRDFTSAGQSAAFVGWVPVAHRSGSSVDRPARLSKAGAPRLRAKLYRGAIVAIQYNAMVREQYERLRARGKAKMSAWGAAMGKRVPIAFGVLKHQTVHHPQGAVR